MNNYIIRVLLHNAEGNDYLVLQQRLANIGVVDVILATDGRWYKLPPAEYVYSGSESAEVVRQACVNAANAVGRSCAVLVSQATHVVWQGLPLVK